MYFLRDRYEQPFRKQWCSHSAKQRRQGFCFTINYPIISCLDDSRCIILELTTKWNNKLTDYYDYQLIILIDNHK